MRNARMLLWSVVVVPLLMGGCPGQPGAPAGSYSDDGISAYFSPKGGCTAAVVEQLAAAKSTIDVQAYSFTSKPIAQALLDAKKRGVKVRVILDRKRQTEEYSEATFLHNSDIPLWLDGMHAIAHNKIIIVDGATLITGSFNFTKQAEDTNGENLLIIAARPKLVEAYEKNFEVHLKHSVAYSRG